LNLYALLPRFCVTGHDYCGLAEFSKVFFGTCWRSAEHNILHIDAQSLMLKHFYSL